MSELKPCPFCGSEIEEHDIDTQNVGQEVICSNCRGRAYLEEWNTRTSDLKFDPAKTDWGDTEEKRKSLQMEILKDHQETIALLSTELEKAMEALEEMVDDSWKIDFIGMNREDLPSFTQGMIRMGDIMKETAQQAIISIKETLG